MPEPSPFNSPARSGNGAALRAWIRARSAVLVALALLGCIALAWLPGSSAPYQYDDYVTPVKDPASQSLSSWARALPHTLRPLTKLSYALESSFAATSAPARRVLNAATFTLAALLLALLSRELGLAWPSALLLSAAWACHPAHAETLLALAGRSVLLALTLTLASALCWWRGRPRAALLCALFALLARETALLWFVVCAALVLRPRVSSRRHWVLAVGGVALLGSALVLASSRWQKLLAFSFGEPGVANRLGLQWAALSRETWLFFAQPGAFNVDMEFAPSPGERLLYIVASMALYASALVLAARPRSPPGVRLAALFWLCWVIPLHSIVPKLDPLTARSVSASSPGWVLLVAALAGRWRTSRRAGAWLGAALLAILIPITRARARLYQDPVALWRDAAQQSQKKTRPLINLGTLLAQRGDLSGARAAFERALGRNAFDPEAAERLDAVRTLMHTKKLLTPTHDHEMVEGHETRSD